MNMIDNNTRKAYKALFGLIFTIIKEQKILLIVLAILTLLTIPLAQLMHMNQSSALTYGYVALSIYLFPLLISLVFLPMVHQIIYGSSLIKRLRVSGITPTQYGLTMIISFTLISTLATWTGLLVFGGIFAIFMDWVEFNFNWFMIIFITPIIWIMFTTTGLFVGGIKMPEIFKGVMIFFIIVLIILTSSTILNPILTDMSDGPAEKLSIIFRLIPWGLGLYVIQGSFIPAFDPTFIDNLINILYMVSVTSLLMIISINRLALR